MTAQLIDGNAMAVQMRVDVAAGVKALVESGGPRPGLATVLVGEDPGSQSYVRSKRKASVEAGIESFGFELPATASQEEVEELVRKLSGEKIPAKTKSALPPEIADIEDRLRSRLGTKVNVNRSRKGGTVVIRYYSEEELDALVAMLLDE